MLDIVKDILYPEYSLSLALLHFSAVLASADTFFFLAPSGEQNVNDMSLWKRLSTYDSSGDNWEFYVFPEGTDDRITLDKGNHAAGAIGADQSQGITADSDVIINRYKLGELQSDGSVAFGGSLNESRILVFTDNFSARKMSVRINDRANINFADAEEININLDSVNFSQIAHTYLAKTTAERVNINVSGNFTFNCPGNQSGCNLDVGAYDGFIDSVSAGSFLMREDVLDLTVNMYAHKADFASTRITNTKEGGKTVLILNVGKLDPLESAIYSLGTARKNADDAITVDFGMVDPGSLSAGEYKIVSIDEWSEGFEKSGLSDFDLRADIFDAYGVEYSFGWDGQNLTLTVVPEPAACAAALGALALFAAACRKGKRSFR